MDPKPKVFPTKSQIEESNSKSYNPTPIQGSIPIQGEIPTQGSFQKTPDVSSNEKLADEELTRQRHEALAQHKKRLAEKENNELKNELKEPMIQQISQPITQPVIPTPNYKELLGQPQYNAAFDVIPLPSEGKLYKNKKSSVKMAFLTTADENILTSPNLLESGEFLEILINRKLLEPDLRYSDLVVGDRNAIMIWLRATGYGSMYPIMVLDENNEPFETEVDLNDLKTIKLGTTPDNEGLFYFELPISKVPLKFKLLSVGEIENIEEILIAEKENNNPVNNSSTYTLEAQLVEVNGSRDREYIRNFASNMRLGDGQKLKKYIDSIDCGVDLDITVGTPGGGSIKTFLPLNIKFFWPNL